MKFTVYCAFVTLLLSGCGTVTPEQQELFRKPKLVFPVAARLPAVLSREYSFTQVRKMNLDYMYVLPAGEYRFYAEDEVGEYFIHAGGGILVNGGKPLKGGFFLPRDPEKRLIVWWQPASFGAAMTVLGPLGAAVGSSDPEHEALLVIHIPGDIGRSIRNEIVSAKEKG